MGALPHDPDHINLHEVAYLQYRFGSGNGSFLDLLFETIEHADCSNQARLRLGFPGEVAAVLAWTQGDLYDRWQRARKNLDDYRALVAAEDTALAAEAGDPAA